jgi:hypothetical protein
MNRFRRVWSARRVRMMESVTNRSISETYMEDVYSLNHNRAGYHAILVYNRFYSLYNLTHYPHADPSPGIIYASNSEYLDTLPQMRKGKTLYEMRVTGRIYWEMGIIRFNINLPASFDANTEADTRAKIVIYLLENGLYRV